MGNTIKNFEKKKRNEYYKAYKEAQRLVGVHVMKKMFGSDVQIIDCENKMYEEVKEND